jgi:hypothetical protein
MAATATKRKEKNRESAPSAEPALQHDQIATLAYSYWEERQSAGDPGSEESDWLRAEAELRVRTKAM